jgi:hypothetical protein
MSKQIRKLVARNSSVRAVVRDPEDLSRLVTDPLRLLSDSNGAAATYQVFDDELDLTLNQSADASDAGVFNLAGRRSRELVIGDRLWMLEDDGTVFNSDIAAVDLNAGTVTTTAALGGDATKGKQVRRPLLAAPGAMAEFGTPTQGVNTWGFGKSINVDLLGLLPLGFHKWSVEIFFKGATGNNDLNRTYLLLAKFDEILEAD